MYVLLGELMFRELPFWLRGMFESAFKYEDGKTNPLGVVIGNENVGLRT
jgi:hypothetical protein